MKNLLVSAAFAFGMATSAAAVPIEIGSFDVTSGVDGDNGLAVQTQSLITTPFFVGDLAIGDSTTFDLFTIWTDETTVDEDDLADGVFTINMTLSGPGGSGTLNGTTFGFSDSFFGATSTGGNLTWDNLGSFFITYGFMDQGLIEVALSDAVFNDNVCFGGQACDLNSGQQFGSTVTATFTNISEPVPAPGALALLGLGLAGLGLRRRRAV